MQGIDLKQEMAKRLKDMEDQWRKEKEEANEAFQQERKVTKVILCIMCCFTAWYQGGQAVKGVIIFTIQYRLAEVQISADVHKYPFS